MKKLIYLSTLFVLALFFNACSSDDDGGSGSDANAETIVGSWEIYEVNYKGDVQFGEFEETIDNTYSTDICDPTPVFTFSADGSASISDFEVEEDFFDEEVVCYVDGEMTGTWEYVSGSTFIVDVDGEPVEADVTMSNGNNRVSIVILNTDFGDEVEVTFRGNRM